LGGDKWTGFSWVIEGDFRLEMLWSLATPRLALHGAVIFGSLSDSLAHR
jgi:hypothetical protein